ncbi:hypothetical protein SLE2022_276800 [Rubroshorea leprosula]
MWKGFPGIPFPIAPLRRSFRWLLPFPASNPWIQNPFLLHPVAELICQDKHYWSREILSNILTLKTSFCV